MPEIKLKRSYLKPKTDDPCRHAWSIEIEAESTIEGLDSKIFVYQAAPISDPIMYDRFSNVASVEDMNLLPEDEPATTDDAEYENTISFYRTNKVALDFYEPGQAERFWRIVKIDVRNLIHNFIAARSLKDYQEISISDKGVVTDVTPSSNE